jgi:hypothetical protein
VWVVLRVPVLWAVVFPAQWRLYRVSLLPHRLGRDAVRVDLDELRSPCSRKSACGTCCWSWSGSPSCRFGRCCSVGSIGATSYLIGVHRSVGAAKIIELDRLTDLLRATARHGERDMLLA